MSKIHGLFVTATLGITLCGSLWSMASLNADDSPVAAARQQTPASTAPATDSTDSDLADPDGSAPGVADADSQETQAQAADESPASDRDNDGAEPSAANSAAAAGTTAEPATTEPAAELTQELVDAAAEVTTDRFTLRYHLQAGEELKYRVEHLATVDTTIEGAHQKTQSRSISTKVWKIGQPRQDDQFPFTHSIADVQMWQEVTGRKAVEYDSRSDAKPPAEYEQVAAQVGKPLAEVVIDSRGKVVERQDKIHQPSDLGFGAITVPLPDQPVAIGENWSNEVEVRARTESGQYKKVIIRQKYTLEKVQTGVATISIRSEVLTPVNDARVRSQIVQRMSQGELKFDMDAGRIISKQLEWNETVIAFNGPESNMKYLARFTESLITDSASTRSASVPAGPAGPAKTSSDTAPTVNR